jgi:2-oxoglutarate dehydrogenase E1 component
MARQEQNEAFLQSSFLYGGNASYLEDLHAAISRTPSSLDAGGASSSRPEEPKRT